MREIILDAETASEVDITEVGTLNYIRHPSTHLLMLSWAIDGGEIQLWEPDLGPMPERLRLALMNPRVLKLAWNVKMERSVLQYLLGIDIPITQWFDIMVLARYCSLPGKLKDACTALSLDKDVSKWAEAGDDMIEMFCMPIPSAAT